MIANFVGDVLFAEDNSLERFVNELTEEKKKTFGDFIRDFINWIKVIFGKTDEVRMLEKKYAELFGSAKEITAKGYVQENSDYKYTLDNLTDNQYNDNDSPVYETAQNRKPVEPVNYKLLEKIRKLSDDKYGLSEAQGRSIRSYVMSANIINTKMRLGTITESDRVYINGMIDALKKFPIFQGRTYRNLKFKIEQEYNAFLEENSYGNTVTLNAFTSTSKIPNGYPLFGKYVVHMVFDGVGGRDIADTYGLPRQQEVLYLPGTKYKVDSVSIANDGNPIIFAKEIATNEVQNNDGDFGGQKLRPDRNERRNMAVPRREGDVDGGVHVDRGRSEVVEKIGIRQVRSPVNLPDPDDSSYSYTPTKAERIAALVDQYEGGLITRDQFEEQLIGKNKDDPISIARNKEKITEEDATTTPDIKRKTGKVKGDGERDTVNALTEFLRGRCDSSSHFLPK